MLDPVAFYTSTSSMGPSPRLEMDRENRASTRRSVHRNDGLCVMSPNQSWESPQATPPHLPSSNSSTCFLRLARHLHRQSKRKGTARHPWRKPIDHLRRSAAEVLIVPGTAKCGMVSTENLPSKREILCTVQV